MNWSYRSEKCSLSDFLITLKDGLRFNIVTFELLEKNFWFASKNIWIDSNRFLSKCTLYKK